MSVFHAVYATTVFVVAYVLIATERFNQTLVALAGATAMFFLPVHGPWWQPHRRGSQREYRRGRHRATRRPSRLLLGLHEKGGGSNAVSFALSVGYLWVRYFAFG